MKRFEERKQDLINATSHLYNEETSREIYKEIKEKYIYEIEKLVNKLEKLNL